MLLEISCSNFKSIRDKATFTMVATGDKSYESELYFYNNYKVSRISALYGMNGAGKTTLVEAIGYMAFLVKECNRLQEGDLIPRSPHKLCMDAPTRFDIQFVIGDVRYAYGFVISDAVVLEEYLYHFPEGRQAKIFERFEEGITFGIKYKKELNEIYTKSKTNKLFLSTAESWSQLTEILNPFKFFKENIVVHKTGPDDWFEYSVQRIKESDEMKNILISFLQNIGMPIEDIKVKIENRPLTASDIPAEILDKMHMFINTAQTNIVEVKCVYSSYELNLKEESLGIQKLFKLICPLIDVLTSGKILFYDELENSLHLVIINELIKLFKEWKGDEYPQLIFTTHETSLLDLDFFRRDQIWFAERNLETSSTEYYSLIEVKNVRKDDNLKKGYINGRYTSIPLKGSNLLELLGGR